MFKEEVFPFTSRYVKTCQECDVKLYRIHKSLRKVLKIFLM